jgi:hypothetical protein
MVSCAFLEYNHVVDPVDEVRACITWQTHEAYYVLRICRRLGNNIMDKTLVAILLSSNDSITEHEDIEESWDTSWRGSRSFPRKSFLTYFSPWYYLPMPYYL